MRWIFLDPLHPQEAAYRAEKHRQINAWWSAFAAKTNDLDRYFGGKAEWDLPAWMQEHLSPIDEGLMWEFGPAVRGEGHRLVITPEAKHHLRPLVQTLLSRAPSLPGWEFYPGRLPDAVEMVQQTVQARTGGEIAGARVQAEPGHGGRVDLLFCLPQCTEPDEQEQMYVALVAAESLLGEETLDRWIGGISVEPLPKSGLLGMFRKSKRRADPARLVSLEQLRGVVESLIEHQRQQLPSNPCWRWIEQAKWSICELRPEQAEDYARRDDLLLAVAAQPDVLEASGSGGVFDSARFSRCGEKFCYVKLDRLSDPDGDPEKYLDREPLDNAVNAKLVPAQLGCVIGGGTGLRYSYIDLALTDLQRGVAAVREALRDQNVPLRTWIQFFDDELAAEWVGVSSEAPPPPGIEIAP
jgi:hypothetical protein